jgi:hypothetical protein
MVIIVLSWCYAVVLALFAGASDGIVLHRPTCNYALSHKGESRRESKVENRVEIRDVSRGARDLHPMHQVKHRR